MKKMKLFSRAGLRAVGGMLGVLLPVASAQAYNISAATAAANGPACTAARPFYWEVGGSTGGPLASGQVGGTTYSRTAPIEIASASKWIFGAYVMQRFNGIPADPIYTKALNMQAGYDQFNPTWCSAVQDVRRCFEFGNNDQYNAAVDGSYVYNGGHSQYIAANPSLLNLGGYYNAGLMTQINSQLNLGPSFSFVKPVLGMGMKAAPSDYAAFLQKLMPGASGGYVMRNHLSAAAVNTLPCPASAPNCSPMGTVAWRYSFNHFIEDNAASGTLPGGATMGPGDGAYSSPGMYGFYPWIRQGPDTAWYYGIVSRKGTTSGYEQSVPCGQAIRAAFFT